MYVSKPNIVCTSLNQIVISLSPFLKENMQKVSSSKLLEQLPFCNVSLRCTNQFWLVLEWQFEKRHWKLLCSPTNSVQTTNHPWLSVTHNTIYSFESQRFTLTNFLQKLHMWYQHLHYIIARLFRGMHWYCQSRGSHFFHPKGRSPEGWQNEKWSCNSISMYIVY